MMNRKDRKRRKSLQEAVRALKKIKNILKEGDDLTYSINDEFNNVMNLFMLKVYLLYLPGLRKRLKG